MAYVITDSCIKDSLCVDVCPTDCIHPKQDEPGFEEATQLFVDPVECIDCGACVPACTSIRFSPSTTFPRIKSRSSSATPPSSRTEPAFLLCAQNRRRSWNRIVESMPRPAPSFHLHVAPNPFTTEPQRKPFFFCFLLFPGFLRVSVPPW